MENRDEPINPCHIKGRQGFADMPTIPNREVYGLTKREYFAGLAMQGLLSRDPGKDGVDSIKLINISISYADALLEALNKE